MKGKITYVKNRIIKQTPSFLSFKAIQESSVIRKRTYKAIGDKNANMFGDFTKAKGYK